MNAEPIFTRIYKKDEWGGGSGEGSEVKNTGLYRTWLQAFLAEKKIKTVLDLGCGDWQSSKLIDWKGIDYTGVDCVQYIIDANQVFYSWPNLHFVHAEIKSYPIPPVDLVILKDVLQHWPHADILDFLPRLAPAKYVIFSNCDCHEHIDIKLGEFRPLNMQSPPFSLQTRLALKFFTKRVEVWEPFGHA